MAVFLIVFGLVLIMSAFNDTLAAFGKLASGDLFGSGGKPGFLVWAGAILVVGAIFKMLDLPSAGKMLITLIIIAYLLGHTDITSKITSALSSGAGASVGNIPSTALIRTDVTTNVNGAIGSGEHVLTIHGVGGG